MATRNGGGTEYGAVGAAAATAGRYADITLEGGEVVIYDVNDEAAWVQSEAAVSLELMA